MIPQEITQNLNSLLGDFGRHWAKEVPRYRIIYRQLIIGMLAGARHSSAAACKPCGGAQASAGAVRGKGKDGVSNLSFALKDFLSASSKRMSLLSLVMIYTRHKICI